MTENQEPRSRIHRTDRNRNYKTIGCAFYDDERLTWKTKGLLGYLLTRPEGWVFYASHLAGLSSGAGRDGVYSSLKQLAECGYLRRTRARKAGGEWDGFNWEISEAPRQDWSTTPVPAVYGSAGHGSAGHGSDDTTNKHSNKEQDSTKQQEGTKKTGAKPDLTQNAEVMEVYGHWQVTLGYENRKPTGALGHSRLVKIHARLKEGFTVAQLKQVVDIAKTDPFLQGENDSGKRYDDIENLFRNGRRVEQRLATRRNIRKDPSLGTPDEELPGREF